MIFVLAGVNGAGKSSIGGSALRAVGTDWYNPDEIAQRLAHSNPEVSSQEIASRVWKEGRRRLIEGIAKRTHFAFETTLGGNSMTHTLLDAIAAGISVNVWYCGLESVELHIQRVAERVARGGHDIPEELIRRRYRSSMRNLCRLTPGLRQLAVFDNSRPLDGNGKPKLRNLLHVRDGDLLALANTMPSWAKPVAAVCVRSAR